MIATKVQPLHRQRPAYVYIRQSTMGQVRHHRESTERQYALQQKALELEWSADQIRILDQDLGLSGAHGTDRQDFQRLVADVSMGRVGAIFALEASRLARSNLDWHRLIEICALTQTLVIDEDGAYDPGDFNDALLLGLKGTLAQAELHFIRARLQGGKLSKAKKGELRFPLPVGLCHDPEHRIVLDPDLEVQGAVRLVFRLFRETGSAYAVVQHFARKGLLFPKRAYGGAWDGRRSWGHLGHGRVIGLLKNPSYAGVYSFGRYQSRKEISAGGEVRTQTKRVAMDAWRVTLQDHHEGYLPWVEFERTQELLARNRTNGAAMVLSGAAREGLALLQGLLLCAQCGRRISVRYTGNGGLYPTYTCTALRREGLSTRTCLHVRCDLLDTAMVERVLAVLQPAQIELAAEALRQLEAQERAGSMQWQRRLERAEYEAQLAERRYEEVDPSNRLVASTLEQRWNDALVKLEELRKQWAEIQSQESVTFTEEQRARVLALARDLPRLWNAPSTQPKDKKRILRLLIKDITVEPGADPKIIVLHVRWQGGACEDVRVKRPPAAPDQVRYPEELVQRVRELARMLPNEQIAEALNREGRRPSKGAAFQASIVRWIRYAHRIPARELRGCGERTVQEIADTLGVSRGVIYYWIARGRLVARRQDQGSCYWIAWTDEKEQELRALVQKSSRIQKRRSNSKVLR